MVAGLGPGNLPLVVWLTSDPNVVIENNSQKPSSMPIKLSRWPWHHRFYGNQRTLKSTMWETEKTESKPKALSHAKRVSRPGCHVKVQGSLSEKVWGKTTFTSISPVQNRASCSDSEVTKPVTCCSDDLLDFLFQGWEALVRIYPDQIENSMLNE